MCCYSDLFKQLQDEQQALEVEAPNPAEVETVAAESPAKGKKSPAAAKYV